MEAARFAERADIAALVALSAALRQEMLTYRGGELWVSTQRVLAFDSDAFATALADDGEAVIVGTIDETVVGFALVTVVDLVDGRRLGVVHELFVDVDARAVGVGESMLEVVVAWCSEHGCIGVDATALPGHRHAKNFFEGHGFTARNLTMHRAVGAPALPAEPSAEQGGE